MSSNSKSNSKSPIPSGSTPPIVERYFDSTHRPKSRKTQWFFLILFIVGLTWTLCTAMHASGADAILDRVFVNATTFQGANITDGVPRLAFIEQEDESWVVYQTINGTTERVTGFDSLDELKRDLLETNMIVKQLTVTVQKLISTLESFTSNFIIPDVYATSFSMSGGNDGGVFIDGVQISGNPSTEENTAINFTALYKNGTVATYTGNQTAPNADLIVNLIDAIDRGTLDAEQLDELVPVPQEIPEEEDLEDIQEEEESDDGGGGGDSSDGDGEPIEPDPSQIEPPINNGSEGGDTGEGAGEEGV